MAESIPRDLLAKYFGDDPRLVAAFEDQSIAVETAASTGEATAAATQAIQDATVLTLSANDAFTNDRVLSVGDGLTGEDAGSSFTLNVNGTVVRSANQWTVSLVPPGNCTLFLPLTGTLATRAGIEDLVNKTLQGPKLSGLGNYVDDAAASAGGVPVGGAYRNGSQVMVRVV